MFRNYLVTALRNLMRNKLYAGISILGLAAGLAAAILIALFVRNEFNYDRWIPGYQTVYEITDVLAQAGHAPTTSDLTQNTIGSQLKEALPGVVATARLLQDYPTIHTKPGDDGEIAQSFSWADPDIFKVLPLPALAGDLKTALQEPDTVVITHEAARKYFGRDLPIGAMLDTQPGPLSTQGGVPPHHYMRVTAVLKDYPTNTSLVTEVFASGRSAYSPLAQADAGPPGYGGIGPHTYVKVAPNVTPTALQRGLDIAGQPEEALFKLGGAKFKFLALPLTRVHLTPPGDTDTVVKPTGNPGTAIAIATVGLLIVLVAGINFVTLMTARASRRAVEVGIRKVAGARRADLIIQFMGEALIQAALSMIIAMILAAILLKPFDAFVQRGLSLDFLHDPALAGGLLAATVLIGLLGGLYPALVLSSFRPAGVLKGGLIQAVGSASARQALVVVQFAILIGLILSTLTIYRQTEFALNQGMGAQRDLTVWVWTACDNAFPEEVRRLPGVQGAACSSLNALNVPFARNIAKVTTKDGETSSFDLAPVDFGFFELYGVKPVAGRLFSRDHAGDSMAPAGPFQFGPPPRPPVVINQTAARDLGYKTPAEAIGQPLNWGAGAATGSQIIGVLPDMPARIEAATDPTFYFIPPQPGGMLSIRLNGKDVAGTVRAINRVWKATGNIRPIPEEFIAQFKQVEYLDIIIQGVTIAICAVAAVSIAALGLFALSAFTTERRTKEIGIRKVMGATTQDVVRLLLWQFTIPVLWAIVIALPAGYLLMNRWLHGFAYRVDLSLWTFVLAAALALAIAWFSVSFQTFMVARAKPAGALRYE